MPVDFLDEAEIRAEDRVEFGSILIGTLFRFFDFSQQEYRICIAVRKVSDDAWQVIELDDENTAKIIENRECEKKVLSLDEMFSIVLI